MEELKARLKHLINEISDAQKFLDPVTISQQISELTLETQKEGFWQDQNHAQKVTKDLSHLQKRLNTWQSLATEVEEALELCDMIDPNKEPQARIDMVKTIADLEVRYRKAEIELFLSQKYDHNDTIISVHTGAGGVDAQDWAEMLLRMYLRYAEQNGYKATMIDKSPGDGAGIKSATIEIQGEFAYGYLKNEKGVHRLVRLSPFNSANSRETSFALVEVIPKIDDEQEIEIKKDDLKIDVFRSSGAGGQSVNTTDSAVRITHIPTGLTVSCQNERSQLQNKERALKILQGKIAHLMEEKHTEAIDELRGDLGDSWGHQIRSYVLHPYKMVKDLRTGYETSQVEDFLDGQIQDCIEASLEHKEKN